MNIVVWLLAGGFIGWAASMVWHDPDGMPVNALVGAVGAFIGGWLLAPMVGAGTINSGDFSVGGLVVSLLGAVILLAIVNFFRRTRVR